MGEATLDLSNPNCVSLDESGRSLAYFCKQTPVKVDARLISDLKGRAVSLGNRDLRLCLHGSPEDPFHEMIILQHSGRYSRPHKHLSKGESYHMVEGSMAAFVFDEGGRVMDVNVLEAGGSFLYRVGGDIYHLAIPLSDLLIYHECKPGPFLGDADSIYPSWAPDGSDIDEASAYTRKLLQVIGIE